MDDLNLSRFMEMLDAAQRRKQDAIEQMLAATHEVAQLECQLRNTQHGVNDTRPPENAGDPNCTPHKWHGDPDNMQYYCPCGARFDVDMSELGALLADVFPGPLHFVEPVQPLRQMSLEEFSAICDSVCSDREEGVGLCAPFPGMGEPWTDEKKAELSDVLRRYPSVSGENFAGSLMTAFLSATPPQVSAHKSVEQG